MSLFRHNRTLLNDSCTDELTTGPVVLLPSDGDRTRDHEQPFRLWVCAHLIAVIPPSHPPVCEVPMDGVESDTDPPKLDKPVPKDRPGVELVVPKTAAAKKTKARRTVKPTAGDLKIPPQPVAKGRVTLQTSVDGKCWSDVLVVPFGAEGKGPPGISAPLVLGPYVRLKVQTLVPHQVHVALMSTAVFRTVARGQR